jgi:hypothetical protein
MEVDLLASSQIYLSIVMGLMDVSSVEVLVIAFVAKKTSMQRGI